MNREQKAVVIDSIKNGFAQSEASFVVGYKGLTVKQLQALRKELRTQKGSFKIAKGRLVKLAVKDLPGVNELSPYFKEQVGVVFADDQVPAVAKVIYDFAKANNNFKLVAGFFDARILPSKDIERIATLPSREVLLSQICYMLNMQIARLLWTLQKVAEAKNKE
jgi:large subunit ribosomal protein L10